MGPGEVFVALIIIGLLVGNLLQPGASLQLTDAARAAGEKAAGGEHQTTTEFLLGIIPTTMVSPLVGELVLQTLFVALLVGFAVQGLGQSGQAPQALASVGLRLTLQRCAQRGCCRAGAAGGGLDLRAAGSTHQR